MPAPVNIFWFRRDIRLHDNAGLYHALKSGLPVLPVFIFDTAILDRLDNKKDARVTFILQEIVSLNNRLMKKGTSLKVFHSSPAEAFTRLMRDYQIQSVFTNTDYEPYATARDGSIAAMLQRNGMKFFSFKDQVIFEKEEVMKDNGTPYTVFTPYSKRWKARLTDFYSESFPVERYYSNFLKTNPFVIPSLQEIGFEKSGLSFPSKKFPENIIADYENRRDYPGIAGTSHLGLHLRFGTISIRELVRESKSLSDIFLGELIWRDFYHMILWHFPQVGEGRAFKPAYEKIPWRFHDNEFQKWCSGNTGYPIVDAGMRELNSTGFMHNRVRMITASFLCKHLLHDWRLGEAYFAEKLLDYDLAANNGGWQWAAGSGCDAAPYFRIFNPALQTKRFDAKFEYIRKWVPEFEEFSYVEPMVDHSFARERCLKTYKQALFLK